MTTATFVSFAQNREDVVLHRALREVENGRYVDVGANDPTVDSVTRAFYEAGWRGISVEPIHAYAQAHREQRPGDLVYEVAASDSPAESITIYEIPDTGLSTLDREISQAHVDARGEQVREVEVPIRRLGDLLEESGWQGLDIHFLSLDVEGAEEQVLRSVDLRVWRPWIIVAEALDPVTAKPSHERWEHLLTDADYRFALFDGLSRFYVAAERWDALHDRFSAPANVLDHFELHRLVEQLEANARLRNDLLDLTAERDHVAQHRDAAVADRNEVVADRDRVIAENVDANTRLAQLADGLDQQRATADAELTRSREAEQAALASALDWREKAVSAWAEKATVESALTAELDDLRVRTRQLAEELTAFRRTLSWRITAPLRKVRARIKLRGR